MFGQQAINGLSGSRSLASLVGSDSTIHMHPNPVAGGTAQLQPLPPCLRSFGPHSQAVVGAPSHRHNAWQIRTQRARLNGAVEILESKLWMARPVVRQCQALEAAQVIGVLPYALVRQLNGIRKRAFGDFDSGKYFWKKLNRLPLFLAPNQNLGQQ